MERENYEYVCLSFNRRLGNRLSQKQKWSKNEKKKKIDKN